MRIGQTTFVVFLSKIVASAIGFVATVYFARVLGAELLGQYALILSLAVWLKLLGSLGISSAISKRISEGNDPHAHFFAGLLLIVGLEFLLVLAVVGARSYVDEYVGTTAAPFVIVLLLTGLFSGLVRSALTGHRLVHVSGMLNAVQIGLTSTIQAALVLGEWELLGLIVGYGLGSLTTGLIGLWFLPIRVKKPQFRHVRSLIDYAKFSWLGALQSRSFNDVDVIVLGLFVPSALVGVYSIAWSISKFLDLFSSAIGSTMFPEISNLSAQKGKQAVSGLVTDSLSYAGLFLIPGLIGGSLLADRLLRIYGPEFVEGSAVLALLIGALLFYSFQKQLINSLNAIDRPDLGFRLNFLFIVTNILFNFVLIWKYGIVGAAVATLVSAGVGVSVSYWMLSRLLWFRFPWREISKQVIAAILMGAAVFGGLWLEETHQLLRYNATTVVVFASLGAGIYFFVLYSISSHFRTTIHDNLPFDPPITA